MSRPQQQGPTHHAFSRTQSGVTWLTAFLRARSIRAGMAFPTEFLDLPAAALRRLARELRHHARTSDIAAPERISLLVRAAHAAELAQRKEPWFANRGHLPDAVAS